jgi:hypothetical protein
MKDTLAKFQSVLDLEPGRLAQITEAESAHFPALGKWSKKQILGHLIDSASNNHQRFVRAQLGSPLNFPAYAQELWVNAQNYQTESWKNLVECWLSYNRHILHVMLHVPADKLGNVCVIGDDAPVTLEFLMRDYLRHLEQHLRQILGD